MGDAQKQSKSNWDQVEEQQAATLRVKAKEVVFHTGRKEIHLAFKNWEGQWRLDIREWFEPEDQPGKKLPTKKGITIPLDDVQEFFEMLTALIGYSYPQVLAEVRSEPEAEDDIPF